jgi:hypothetical protein
VPFFHTFNSAPVKAPFGSPSIDVWLSWHPEMRIAAGLNLLATPPSRGSSSSAASTLSGSCDFFVALAMLRCTPS